MINIVLGVVGALHLEILQLLYIVINIHKQDFNPVSHMVLSRIIDTVQMPKPGIFILFEFCCIENQLFTLQKRWDYSFNPLSCRAFPLTSKIVWH